MFILGLVMLVVGALLILAAVFTAEVVAGSVEFIGLAVGPVLLFFLGLIAGVAILWGFTVTRFGAKRSMRQRKENHRLTELSEKLDRVDADRRRDPDHDNGNPHI